MGGKWKRKRKKHLISESDKTLCGHPPGEYPGDIVWKEEEATCGLCLIVLDKRKNQGGRKHDDPEYWNKHRARKIAEGVCHKCGNKLYKWGMCRKHVKANMESTVRRRGPLRKVVNGTRQYFCGKCGKSGHQQRTCKRRSR